MFSPALANRIGKRRGTVDRESYVFDFNEAKPVTIFETQI
jgi:hypothetical protein